MRLSALLAAGGVRCDVHRRRQPGVLDVVVHVRAATVSSGSIDDSGARSDAVS